MEQTSNTDKKKKPSQYDRKKVIRISTISAIILFLAIGAYIFKGLPSLEELENPKPVLASKVYGIDGELIGQFFIENRIEVPLDSIPKHLQNALIATEDRKFYDHWGVDVGRFFKAMVKNVFTLSMREGASTITQQLAKNLYKLKSKNENKFETVIRKIREWITAIQIEKTYTKDEILDMYLNISYFGRGAYGVETAANAYFNKDAKDLTVPESAVLVALLKSSVNYDPAKHYDRSLQRRNVVMANMVEAGYLNENFYERYKNLPIALGSERFESYQTIAPHFMEYIRRQMEKLSDKYGYDLYRDGLNIYTTIDSRMQLAANKAVADHLAEYQPLFNKSWNWEKHKDILTQLVDKAIKTNPQYLGTKDPDERKMIYDRLISNQRFIDSVKRVETSIQVGFVAIDPSNGHIRAMVGGADPKSQYGLNHVSGIKRQPGSAFKPIVYATAIENGLYPSFPLLNQPFTYNGWSPHNSDFSTGGYTTMRSGLANSLNLITARLIIEGHAPLSQIGNIAKKMGIQSKLDLVPSIALGTSEVSPLELTSAFGTLANNGINVSPISILEIKDKDGILIEKFYPDKITEALSASTAAITTSMMQSVVDYGTGAGVRRFFHRPAAGKTGTTQDFGDAWFVGFTPQLVAGVWVGFDDRRVSFTGWYGQGAKAAAPIWGRFMEGAYQNVDMPLKYFQLPSDVISVDFCAQTISEGKPKLATEYCPEKVTDIINKNDLPDKCDIHQGGSISPF
ncbi:MAG TPA: PBP1A family penicillin-binding protein [Ignavibacteriales bacterium]|nr:PBP1A family penicillin-binding protein [Ignavibacteriales bacterium]